jgi:hypothetical protein
METADKLAAELGDLPLAAAQAAGYLEQTGLPSPDYLRRLRTHRAGLLAAGDVLDCQGRVDTTWAISLERLHTINPAAVALLEISSYLAPDPIPISLFTEHPDLLDETLRTIATDPRRARRRGRLLPRPPQPGRLPTAPPAANSDPQPDAHRPTRSLRGHRRRAARRRPPRRPRRTRPLGQLWAARRPHLGHQPTGRRPPRQPPAPT